MNKHKNENKLVPRLRFPEFVQTSKWVVSSVEDECLVKGRIGYRGYTTNDLVSQLVLGGKHIQNQILDLSDPTYLTWEKYYESPEIMIEIGDIVFSQRGTLGDCAIIEKEIGPATINPSMVLLKNITCIPKFLYYFLIGDYIQNEIKKSKGLGAIPMLSQKQIKDFSFLKPDNPNEQQKIAACLSSLDDLITAERQKLDVLKAHKKGLLQNLFPREGETAPRVRFKEFEDSGEWEVSTLGEIALFLKGKGISKADVDEKGKQPCIRYGELYTHYGEVIKEVRSFTNLNGEDLMFSEPNDVIIPSSGETKEDIATASCVKLGGVALGGDLNILRSSLNGDFLAYYLSHGLKKAISKIAQGDAVVHLYATQLKKLIIRVPLKNKEQQKIASTLSSIDELITAQAQKIETLQVHKKGLLQGLFPDLNEVPT
jgi:type I restriction enzyme, S subunit